MKIKTTITGGIFKVVYESGNASIVEDLAVYSGDKNGFIVEEHEIESLIMLANEMSRYNKTSDISFVEKIAEAFLNDNEKEILIKRLTNG